MKPLNPTPAFRGASVTGAWHFSRPAPPTIVLNLRYGILWVNQAFERTFGYSLEEVRGERPDLFLQGPETDLSAIENLRAKIRGQKPFEIELLEYSKSGNRYWMLVKGQPLFGRSDNCIGFCITQEHLTCRTLAQPSLPISTIEGNPSSCQAPRAEPRDAAPAAEGMRRGVLKKVGHRLFRWTDALGPTLLEQLGELTRSVHLTRRNDPDLVADIRALIDQIETGRPITITLDSELFSEKRLNRKRKLNVFRVVQEQLGNITKFSGATAVKVSLRVTERDIFLDIQDNGRPVDPSQKERGICVTDILSCAEMNDGRAVLETAPGVGSHLRVEFSMPACQSVDPETVRSRSMPAAVSGPFM